MRRDREGTREEIDGNVARKDRKKKEKSSYFFTSIAPPRGRIQQQKNIREHSFATIHFLLSSICPSFRMCGHITAEPPRVDSFCQYSLWSSRTVDGVGAYNMEQTFSRCQQPFYSLSQMHAPSISIHRRGGRNTMHK